MTLMCWWWRRLFDDAILIDRARLSSWCKEGVI